VVLADWFLAPPARPPRYADVPWLLVYPVAYAAYSLVRGRIVDWYPYPFLDPREDGYASLALSVAVVSLGVVAMAFALVRFTPSLRGGPTCCEPVHRSG
jgi:hypothetical protein